MNEQQTPQAKYLETYIEKMNQQLESEQLRSQQLQNEFTKDSVFPKVSSDDLVSSLLNVERLLDRAFHLLSGHIIKRNDNGEEVWDDPSDNRLKIFSKYGVERILNILSFYITPEVVTSVLEDEDIKRETYNCGLEITDLISNRYELIFEYPKPEELYEQLYPIIKEEGIEMTDEELYYNCVNWSSEELKLKLANYPVIVRSLVALVYANYRRALRGETLKSFRTITHISQSLGQPSQMPYDNQNKFNILKPGTWGKR